MQCANVFNIITLRFIYVFLYWKRVFFFFFVLVFCCCCWHNLCAALHKASSVLFIMTPDSIYFLFSFNLMQISFESTATFSVLFCCCCCCWLVVAFNSFFHLHSHFGMNIRMNWKLIGISFGQQRNINIEEKKKYILMVFECNCDGIDLHVRGLKKLPSNILNFNWLCNCNSVYTARLLFF